MSSLRPTYYRATAPPHDPDWHPLDGLDGVMLNGREVGWAHRERVRRQAEAVRRREIAQGWLTADDDG